MAVVFISPRKRQKVFFMGITIIFLLFLLAVFLGVFLAKPKQATQTVVFNKPKVDINMNIFDSDQFKDLKPFIKMEMQYSYTATTESDQPRSGFITAASIDQARERLISMGLTVIKLEEAEIGRDNPFTPYYQDITLPTP